MNKSYSAQEGGGGEACYVTDHATANRNYQRFAIGSGTTKGTSNLFHAAEILCGFSVIKEMNGAALGNPQAALNGFSRGAPDFGRGNDVEARKPAESGNFPRGAANYADAGENCVGTGGGFHENALHFHG